MSENTANGPEENVTPLKLRDGKEYALRLLHAGDEEKLQAFFYTHTEDTIHRRYGFTLTQMTRERAFELVAVDQRVDHALAVIEWLGEEEHIRAVGRYYLDPSGKSCEMAFVVAEDKRRLGMTSILLHHLMKTARSRGLEEVWAQVERDNLPMLALFRKEGFTESPAEGYNAVDVRFPLANY